MKPSESKPKRFASAVGWLVFFALALGIYLSHNFIRDQLVAMQFQPSAPVATIARNISFSPTGERLFYASEPTLDASSNFTEDCDNTEKTSVVLGCYYNRDIFLFDVTNDELNGIEEVTAAHEVLHAAYERLNIFEKRRVNQMLEDKAAKLRTNPEFRERMSVYDDLSRDDQLNELHSVVGTEIEDIDPELEAYYARYFNDRARIVEYYTNYKNVFADLIEEADRLAAQLDSLAASINSRVESYEAASAQLDADIRSFNARADAGEFSSLGQFNAARSPLVARQNQLESLRLAINADIDRYEALKQQYDGLSGHLAELNNSIDSKLAPKPQAVN